MRKFLVLAALAATLAFPAATFAASASTTITTGVGIVDSISLSGFPASTTFGSAVVAGATVNETPDITGVVASSTAWTSSFVIGDLTSGSGTITATHQQWNADGGNWNAYNGNPIAPFTSNTGWGTLQIRLSVPANQPVGVYSGSDTLTVTTT